MLSKRGMVEIMMNVVYELLIAAMLGLGFFMFINHLVSHVALDKEFLSRDTGILTQLTEYSPYPYYTLFNPDEINLSKYDFNWTGSDIFVSYYEKDGNPKIHPFLRNKNIFQDNIRLKDSKKIYFVNKGGKLLIENTEPELKINRVCGKVNKDYNKIFLDPAHGEEKDLGFNKKINSRSYNESKIMCNLVNYILPFNKRTLESSRNLDGNTINCEAFRQEDEEIIPKIETSDLYIGFRVGDYPTERNIIKAYVKYNDDFSDAKNIACKILNAISEKLDVDTVIIPVDEGSPLFGMANAAVVLQFGSFESEKTLKMLDNNISYIASQIKGVIDG